MFLSVIALAVWCEMFANYLLQIVPVSVAKDMHYHLISVNLSDKVFPLII